MNPIIIKIKNKPAVVFALLGIVFGILAARYFLNRVPRFINPALPYISLAELETDLENTQAALKSQISSGEDQINQLSKKNQSSDLQPEIVEVDRLKSQAGLTPVSGAGVVITLDDSPARRLSPNSIAHASDLRDLVDYLWQNDANAVSITGAGEIEERVGPTTSIDCIVNTVLINNVKIVPPFKIKAIGDPSKLKNAVEDRTRLKDIYKRQETENLAFAVEKNDSLFLPKFTGNIIFQYAKTAL